MVDPLVYGYVEITCPVCKGKGIIPTPDGKKWQLCPRCHGTGKIRTTKIPKEILNIKYPCITKTW